MIREYRLIRDITGPVAIVESAGGIACGDYAELPLPGGVRRGRVLEAGSDAATVLLAGEIDGAQTTSGVRFFGRPYRLPLSSDIVGRVFNGAGKPIDGGPDILAETLADINGAPASPFARKTPSGFIKTGISAIDGLSPLIRGQSLPIFTTPGLPHYKLAAQIARQARVSDTNRELVIVLAAIGITFEECEFFIQDFNHSGVIFRSAVFTNLAGDPSAERLMTPRIALTAAEFLAFEKDMDVLVIMADMTRYGESLREMSAARRDTPGNGGYPGYMHADFASLYERAGLREGASGSVTLLPILTMPGGDITHPIPDTTGYTTEGRIVLSRDLYQNRFSPLIDILASRSRYIDKLVTREDHIALRAALLSAYEIGREAQKQIKAFGKDSATERMTCFAEFSAQLEARYIAQDFDEVRSIEDTLALGWELLKILPDPELRRMDPALIEQYMTSK